MLEKETTLTSKTDVLSIPSPSSSFQVPKRAFPGQKPETALYLHLLENGVLYLLAFCRGLTLRGGICLLIINHFILWIDAGRVLRINRHHTMFAEKRPLKNLFRSFAKWSIRASDSFGEFHINQRMVSCYKVCGRRTEEGDHFYEVGFGGVVALSIVDLLEKGFS